MSAKNAMDASGLVVVITPFIEVLPTAVTVIGGLLSIAWYAVRFYDRFVNKVKDGE